MPQFVLSPKVTNNIADNLQGFNEAYRGYIDQPTASWNQLGVDYWFTRCGHGCGFWDRGMGELGDRLTDLAKFCGSADTYEGEDGLLYV